LTLVWQIFSVEVTGTLQSVSPEAYSLKQCVNDVDNPLGASSN